MDKRGCLRLDTNGVNKVSLLVLLGSLFLYVCNEVLSGKHLFTIFFDSLQVIQQVRSQDI